MEIVNKIQELPWHPTRLWRKRPVSSIKKIILHQELGTSDIAGVNQYHITPGPNNHISSRGCPHFCYHYGIEESGEILQVNELSDITWHCKGQNEVSVGIMLVGNFNGPGYDMGSEGPNEAQLKAMEFLVKHLQEALQLTNQDVYGHYHYGKPACPGFVVTEWLEKWRNDISTEPKSKKVEKTREEIQKRLKALGYYHGEIDGIIGVKSVSAIRRFQKDYNLVADGIVGPNTWKTLLANS